MTDRVPSPLLRVFLLGDFTMEMGDGTPVDVSAFAGRSQSLLLLKLLLCQPQRRLTRDQIINIIWPGQSAIVMERSLSVAKSLLNTGLENLCGQPLLPRASGDPPTYQLAGYPLLWTDIDACEQAIRSALAIADAQEALVQWDAAYSLLQRGDLLSSDRETYWYQAYVVQNRRQKVAKQRVQCVLRIADLALECGNDNRATGILKEENEVNPSNQEIVLHLMELLARQGQHREALQCYARLEAALLECNVEPNADIQGLGHRLRSREITGKALSPRYLAPEIVPDNNNRVVATEQTLYNTGEMITRREANKRIVTFGTGLLVAPSLFDLMHIGTLLHTKEILSISATHIPIFWRLFFDGQLAEVQRLLPDYISHLTPLAQQPSHYQKSAASLASQTHQLAAILTLEHEDFGMSFAHCKQAFFYGQIADDHNLQTASLIRQINTLYYRKRYTQILQTLQEAEHRSRDASPLMRGRVYSDIAASYARHGRKQEADRYMGISHEVTPEQPEDDSAFLYTHTDHYILYLNDTLCYLRFHQLDDAFNAITKAATFVPETLSSRRIELLNHQLSVAIAQGDLDFSIASLEAAIESGRALGSELYLSETQEIYQLHMLPQWPYEQRVKALADLFHGF